MLGIGRAENRSFQPVAPPVGSKHFHRFLVLLLALAATLVFGLESVVTPAMVSHNQSPARTPAVARNDSATNLLCSMLPLPVLQYPDQAAC